MDDIFYWFTDKILSPLIMIVIMGLVLIGIPDLIYSIYTDGQRPTFELKKDSWACSKSHTEEHCAKGCWTDKVCDQWSAR